MLNSLYRFYFINGGISDEENGCHIFDVITFFSWLWKGRGGSKA
ncbi:conserved hypothetical protein [Listeria monocytogenes]|nr:hypothetical protein LMntsn_2193 [Listeria monocytogenes]EXL28072.1 hypothetical protein X846_0458 [Listeria monocytogenes Lm_1886]KKO41568.1 hypothetical protein TZ05_2186c [Listeria monocytogenes]KSZ41236.1 hypothetical protein AN945_1251 [Listeria monocytogenes]KSZ44816.1 hypothetical protein AN919_1031 [Listeria monocytogenes]